MKKSTIPVILLFFLIFLGFSKEQVKRNSRWKCLQILLPWTLGIHFEKRFTDVIGLELFVCGGPLFGQCKWSYESKTEQTTNGNVTSTSTRDILEKGSGTGVTLEGGLRINYSMGKHFGWFVETGYA